MVDGKAIANSLPQRYHERWSHRVDLSLAERRQLAERH